MLTSRGKEGEGALMENDFFSPCLERKKKDNLVKSRLPGQRVLLSSRVGDPPAAHTDSTDTGEKPAAVLHMDCGLLLLKPGLDSCIPPFYIWHLKKGKGSTGRFFSEG